MLGSTLNGSLRLQSDAVGVRVEIDLPDTQVGRDVLALVRRGDVAGMRFAMIGTPRGPTTTEKGVTVVNVESFVLDEVTVTAIPAFRETSIAVKPAALAPAYAIRPAHSGRLELERMKLRTRRLLPG